MSLPIPFSNQNHHQHNNIPTNDNYNFSFSPSSPIYIPRYQDLSPRPSASTIPPILDVDYFSSNPNLSIVTAPPISDTNLSDDCQHHHHGPASPMEEDSRPISPIKRSFSGIDTDRQIRGGGPGRITLEFEEDELRRGPPDSDIPGGDCKSLCIRHQRMANGAANLVLQQVCHLSPLYLFVHPRINLGYDIVNRIIGTCRTSFRKYHLVTFLIFAFPSTTSHPPRTPHHRLSISTHFPSRCSHARDAFGSTSRPPA